MLAIWIFLCSFSLFYSYFKFTALSVLRAALRWFLSSSEAIPTLSSIISQPPPSHSHSFALFLGPLRPCLSLAPVKSSHYSWMRGCLSWHSSAPTCTGSLTQRPWQLSALSPLTPTPPHQPTSSASALVSTSSLSPHLITSNMIEIKLLFPHAAWESVPISLRNDRFTPPHALYLLSLTAPGLWCELSTSPSPCECCSHNALLI